MAEVIGGFIAEFRRANRLSQGDFADRLNAASGSVRLTRSEVSRWERGARVPVKFWAEWIAAVTGTPFDRVQAACASARALRGRIPVPSLDLPEIVPDPDQRDRILGAMSGSVRTDRATLEWIRTCLRQHRSAEDVIGARPIAPLARAQLETLVSMANGIRGEDQTVAIDLAAQYAQFLGWMSVITADHGAATAWYTRSHEWADAAGNAEMAATTLSMRAHHAWGQGDSRLCHQLISAADGYSGLSFGLRGMLRQTSARGHALAGNVSQARTELQRAGELLHKASDPANVDPDWLYFYSDDWLLRQRGTIELQLGKFDVAVELLVAGYERSNPDHVRDQAWIGSCLSLALAESGHTGESVKVASEIVEHAIALNQHAVEKLREAHGALRARDAKAADQIKELMRAAA